MASVAVNKTVDRSRETIAAANRSETFLRHEVVELRLQGDDVSARRFGFL